MTDWLAIIVLSSLAMFLIIYYSFFSIYTFYFVFFKALRSLVYVLKMYGILCSGRCTKKEETYVTHFIVQFFFCFSDNFFEDFTHSACSCTFHTSSLFVFVLLREISNKNICNFNFVSYSIFFKTDRCTH